MGYREELRRRISSWTGLTGVEVEHILNGLQEKHVDPMVVDWKTMGEEIRDYGDRYQAAWDWLNRMYGISKPVELGLSINLEEEIHREGEQLLMQGEEGVKEILRRIYSGGLSKKEEELWRDLLVSGGIEYVTLIALYNGSEKELAKQFLEEEVIKRGKVEPVEEEVKKISKAEEEELMKKVEEELWNLIESKMKKKEELERELREKLMGLESKYIVLDIDIGIDGSVTVIAKPRPGYEEVFMGKKGMLFKVEGSTDNIGELEQKIIKNMQMVSEQLFAMKTFTGKPIIPTITGGEEVEVKPKPITGAKLYQCLTCGYIASGSRAEELGYICPKCGDVLYPVE